LEERWKFDSEDALPVGPEWFGRTGQNFDLIDDYGTMYGRFPFFSFSLAHQSLVAGI
jgi:hypothetical protein